MGYERELATALSVCRQAGDIQTAGQQRELTVARKDDRSPVTDIDTRCEELIRGELCRAFAQDGLLGEEQGEQTGTSGRRWIIDPLDGTRPYLRHIPTYSVLLALEEQGDPVVGVIHLPAMQLTCWAARGQGAFCNGERVEVSATSELRMATGSALGYVGRNDETGRRLLDCMAAWDYAYGFMDAYTYVAVITGRLDLCVNLLDKPWDCAAAACIVREAGGSYSDIAGQTTVHNGSFVISNGLLHEQILSWFRQGTP